MKYPDIERVNELHPELMSICSISPFEAYNSSPRKQMFSSQLGQTLVVKGATERRIQSGMEASFGKHTFNIKAPCDMEVIKVIEKYSKTIDSDNIKHNPESIVIYRDKSNNEISYLGLPKFCSNHPYFGFDYVSTDNTILLSAGSHIPKGTVLLESPSVTREGGYKFGVECNVALMSHPAVAEDGIMISRDVLDKFKYVTFHKRVVEFGRKKFPLNIYGNLNEYKAFPDIGDRIREDGLLCMLREYDPMMAPVAMGIADVSEPDYLNDEAVYVPAGKGTVVDIKIYHEDYVNQPGLPDTMKHQLVKYDKATKAYYGKVMAVYNQLKHDYRDNLKLNPSFHRFVVEAISATGGTKKNPLNQNKVDKLYKHEVLDDYRLEFTIRYENTPSIKNKLSGCHGDKGVIVHIAEPEEMPIDDFGNRADIVMDPASSIARMNPGRIIEQKINAAARDTVGRLKVMMGVTHASSVTDMYVHIKALPAEVISNAWNYLIEFYRIVSPEMYDMMIDGKYTGEKEGHLAKVLVDGIYLFIPSNHRADLTGKSIPLLNKLYPTNISPVTYIDYSGKKVRTKSDILIGSMYIILLEKTGEDWTAVSSGKTQHNGVLALVNNNDKHSQPARFQAIRALGESETRILEAYCSELLAVELLDRNNNPVAHRVAADTILSAPKPTDIDVLIDRNTVPYGGSKPVSMFNHISFCYGFDMQFKHFEKNYKGVK